MTNRDSDTDKATKSIAPTEHRGELPALSFPKDAPLRHGNTTILAGDYYTASQYANVERALAESREEVSGLRAARMAYASEFPLNADGEPDVGNIHANIRALKAQAEQLRSEVERLRTVAHGFVDEIASKDRRAERLAEALRPFVGATLTHTGVVIGLMREDFDNARAALTNKETT